MSGYMPLLKVQNLSINFAENKILRGVSFDIKKGETLALVGESGSGKSLTALSCLGLQPANASVAGDILFSEKKIEQKDFRKIRGSRASMIFQEPMTALNPLHTIGKQIGEMLLRHPEQAAGAVKDLKRAARDPSATPQDDKIKELLKKVGLQKFIGRENAYPHELSGGERQRVMIAMAIAANPDLLIADEPTTALDVTIQAKILELLKDLQQQMGMAMLFITHDLTIVRRIADRVAVMKNGEIVEIGAAGDVLKNPQHEYTKMLLASEPKGEPLAPAKNAKTIIECKNLKVYFPIKAGIFKRTSGYVKAVDDVSFTLKEGASLGIVGESGDRKSVV